MSQQKPAGPVDTQVYERMIRQAKPRPNVLVNLFWAFVVGGLICVLGQLMMNFFLIRGLDETGAGNATAIVLIFLGAFFTGLGVYDELGKYAGAGSIIPITGFANSIVASAMDYKNEGWIFGVGARLFQIAGPVLVYGFVASVAIGLLALLFR